MVTMILTRFPVFDWLQAVKKVFRTERAEFSRCRINIDATVRNKYLEINPLFLEEVQSTSQEDLEEYEKLRDRVQRLKKALLDLWAQEPVEVVKEIYGDLLAEMTAVKVAPKTETSSGPHPRKQPAEVQAQPVSGDLRLASSKRCQEVGQPSESAAMLSHAKTMPPERMRRQWTGKGALRPGANDSLGNPKKGHPQTDVPTVLKDVPIAPKNVPTVTKEEADYFNKIQGALKQAVANLEPKRRKVVLQMQDTIRRFGAVWVESVSV
jgi:hypothetical protein